MGYTTKSIKIDDEMLETIEAVTRLIELTQEDDEPLDLDGLSPEDYAMGMALEVGFLDLRNRLIRHFAPELISHLMKQGLNDD